MRQFVVPPVLDRCDFAINFLSESFKICFIVIVAKYGNKTLQSLCIPTILSLSFTELKV